MSREKGSPVQAPGRGSGARRGLDGGGWCTAPPLPQPRGCARVSGSEIVLSPTLWDVSVRVRVLVPHLAQRIIYLVGVCVCVYPALLYN